MSSSCLGSKEITILPAWTTFRGYNRPQRTQVAFQHERPLRHVRTMDRSTSGIRHEDHLQKRMTASECGRIITNT